MKHFVTISLLAVLLGTVGCLGYRPVTSSYYTPYYSSYDWYNQCYYHPSRLYRCCGYGPGFGYIGGHGGGVHFHDGANRTFNGGAVQHPGGSHRGGGSRSSGGGHHGGSGGGHSSGGHSHSSSNHGGHK